MRLAPNVIVCCSTDDSTAQHVLQAYHSQNYHACLRDVVTKKHIILNFSRVLALG